MLKLITQVTTKYSIIPIGHIHAIPLLNSLYSTPSFI
ncbi:hypothetical protein BVRB_2g040130 [Beta vulgaris subsp. vulgaris]|nr:hypothetical protein BVRB_2g040130 [Beta vulgaris subsp. vulgaris]